MTLQIQQWDYKLNQYNNISVLHKLDFASIIIERWHTEIKCEPMDFMALLGAKEKNEYEIDLSGGTNINYNRILFRQYGYFHTEYTPLPHIVDTNASRPFLPTIFWDDKSILSHQDKDLIELQNVSFAQIDIDAAIGSGLYFAKCNRTTNVKMEVNLMLYVSIGSILSPTLINNGHQQK